MRVDKLLSHMKYGSRKEIKKAIKNKLLTVNNEIIINSGYQVDEKKDIIIFNGERVHYKQYVYIMLNKPKGYISATNDRYHKTVIDLLDKTHIYDVFPCGRLDIDTEGLLILSNDGQFAHQLTHPKKEIYKTYYVEVDKPLLIQDIKHFKEGIYILDGIKKLYKTKKALLEIKDEYKALVSISEGKYHQVKRMFQKLGYKVKYLKRIKIGKLLLDDNLSIGEYRELKKHEISLLFENENKMEEY